LKPEAHSLVVVVCRKGLALRLLPLLGACHLLVLALAQAATTSSPTTTLSVVTSPLDAIGCVTSSGTSDQQSRHYVDNSTDSPSDYLVGPGPAVDRAHGPSKYQQAPLHFAGANVDMVPSPPPRGVLRTGGVVSSFSEPLQEIRERGPPTA
jgi:hypothetical protein